MTNAETQLASYFANYPPPIAKLGQAVRKRLQARLPGLFEIVYLYERQRALVIAYAPTDRGYEGLCSLALYPDQVKLYFAQGARLATADKDQLLQGRGTVRYVALGAVADFDRAAIEHLMAAALQLAKLRLDPNGKGAVTFRVAAQQQRARRAAAAAARPAAKQRAVKGPAAKARATNGRAAKSKR